MSKETLKHAFAVNKSLKQNSLEVNFGLRTVL